MIKRLFLRRLGTRYRTAAYWVSLGLWATLAGCGGPDEPAGTEADGRARRLATTAQASGSGGSAGGGGSESVTTEAAKLIQADDTLAPQGNELFGDRIGLYQGSLEFAQADISLLGNSGIPIRVGRRHTAPVTRLTSTLWGTTGGMFGDWDLDIPHLHGVFAKSSSTWIVESSTAEGRFLRCSQFAPPPTVNADQTAYVTGMTGALFAATEYWQGNFLYAPGAGSQELLLRNLASPTPGDTNYPITTKDRWLIKCLPSVKYGQGEGFLAIAPDGTQYRFDWVVSRPGSRIVKSSNGISDRAASPLPGAEGDTKARLPVAQRMMGYFLDRKEVWILPTEVIDRHGNKVTYTWSAANPWQLLSIQDEAPAANPRVVTFSYVPNTNLVAKVVHNGREWNYSYRSTTDGGGLVLSSLQLPDNSQWTFSLDKLTYGAELVVAAQAGCDAVHDLNTSTYTGSMTHPSGAVGTFSVRATGHGRSRVIRECRDVDGGDSSTAYPWYPYRTDRFSLIARSIAGPGLLDSSGQPVARWSYDYGAANHSWAPCTNCPTTKTVTVADGSGDLVRYTFGNEFRVSEGQLLAEEHVDHSDPQALRRIEYTYQAPNAGALPFADPIGTSLQRRGDGDLASRHAPLQKKVTTQKGVTFTWEAQQYDQFAKPVRLNKWSSLGYQTGEEFWRLSAGSWQLGFNDNIAKWVLGQTEVRKLASGVEIERHEYDAANGDKLRTWSFGQFKHHLAYNADGTLKSRIDATGKLTQLLNYKRGQPQTVVYHDGSSESAVIDNQGQIASFTNAAGTTTSFEYNPVGRLSKVIYPTGDQAPYLPTVIDYAQRWTVEYGIPAGHWVRTATTGNAVTETYFDGQWRPVLTRTKDSGNEGGTRTVVAKRYDAYGRKIFESYPRRDDVDVGDSLLPSTTTQYDALGRVKQVSQTSAGMTRTDYEFGVRRKVTNPRGYVTTFDYQAFDEPRDDAITQIWAPEGVTVTISRDEMGKALSITRAGGGKSATRSYVYDGWQRLCKTIEPETGATVQHLDALSNLDWRASGLNLPNGACDHDIVPANRKITFEYDARDRLKRTSFGDGSPGIARSYTPDGLLQQIITQHASVPITWNYTYNNRRILVREQYAWWVGSVGANEGWLFHHAIDAYGHASSLADHWGTLSYAPNALGEPTQVSGYATGVSYHPTGAVAGYTLANGITHSTTLNARGLPLRISNTGLTQDAYTYDANGNIASITDEQEGQNTRTMPQTGGYDGLDRLRQATGPWGTATFDYDALDNLVSSGISGAVGVPARNLSHTIEATTNRLTSLTGAQTINIGYDPNGNINSRGAQAFNFDIGNRMLNAPGKVNYYLYDGHGRRNVVGFADGASMHQAYTKDGKLRMGWRNTEGHTRHVYLGDKLIAETLEGTTTFLHTDALGSPIARTNSSGGVISRTRYEPYGATVAGSTNPTKIGFTGHVNDADTGLVYMQQRYFDPIAGRFLSVDPVVTDAKTGDSFNRYVYGNNNPYRYVDPDGRQTNPVSGEGRLVERDYRSNSSNPSVGKHGLTRTDSQTGAPKFHNGADIKAPIGTPLLAPISGNVSTFASPGEAGNMVTITGTGNYAGVEVKLMHLNELPSTSGKVSEGQMVGTSGNTGNAGRLTASGQDHVHMQVKVNGPTINGVPSPSQRLDPASLLNQSKTAY